MSPNFCSEKYFPKNLGETHATPKPEAVMKMTDIETTAETVPTISGVVNLASTNQKAYPNNIVVTVSESIHTAPLPMSTLLIF